MSSKTQRKPQTSKTRQNQEQEIEASDLRNTLALGNSRKISSLPKQSSLETAKKKHQKAKDSSTIQRKKDTGVSSSPAAMSHQVVSNANPVNKPGQLKRPTKPLRGGDNLRSKFFSTINRYEQARKLSSTQNHTPTHKDTIDTAEYDSDDVNYQEIFPQHSQEQRQIQQSDGAESERNNSHNPPVELIYETDKDQDCPEEIELFGQDVAWQAVIKGASSILGAAHTEKKKLPPLSTLEVKHIVNRIESAGYHFKWLSEKTYVDKEEMQSIAQQLVDELTDINIRLKNLKSAILASEASEDDKSKVIRDLYAHAIPKSVFMLRWGFLSLQREYSQPEDTNYISVMIAIQDTVLLACSIARSWKKKVISDTSIISPTSQKIFPNLRTIEQAFADQLKSRRSLIKEQRNALMVASSHDRRVKNAHLKKEETIKMRKERAIQLHLDLNQSASQKITSHKLASNDMPRKEPSMDIQWTDDQDLELMTQLQNPATRHLPGLYFSIVSFLT